MTDHPRYYWTADRSELVGENDPRAASLAYPSADPIAPEHLSLLEPKPEPGKALEIAQASAPKPAPAKRVIRKA
jgi:hypothetical protein